MSCRKWLVRGLVFILAGVLTCAALVYLRWTSPAVVRQQVLARLQTMFPHAAIALESARMRLLGGIALNELRLVRQDDPTRTDFAYVPSARISYDKEQLLDGKLALRKVELYRPRLRLLREKDGSWNWTNLMGPTDVHATWPTLVIDDGTVLLIDRQVSPGLPPLEISHVQLTVVNDPLHTVTFSGTGQSETIGLVELRGTWRRDTHEARLSASARGVPVTTSLVRRLCSHSPQADLTGLLVEGTADVQAQVQYHGGSPAPLTYNVACTAKLGKLQHPKLPLALDGVQLSARCLDGLLTLDRLTASAGSAQVLASGEARLPNVARNFHADLNVTDLPVSWELCQRLPVPVQLVYKAIHPTGVISADLAMDCQQGIWKQKTCKVRPEGLTVCYERFQYPVHRVRGTIETDMIARLVKIAVKGQAGSRPVVLTGRWKDNGPAADVALDLHAEDIPLDETLTAALPTETIKSLARSFHAVGRADIVGHIRHVPGAAKYANTYLARFHDTAAKWDGFGYPLGNVTGTLLIYPDHWEFRDFNGSHNGAKVHINGQSFPPDPSGPPEASRILIELAGQNVGIDADLRAALKPMPALARAWDCFRPSGRLNFQAKVDRLPGKPQNLDIGVDVHGCSVLPVFLPYVWEDLSGQFHYKGHSLHVQQLRARHGASNLTINEADVIIAPGGGYAAVFNDVWADPVVPDSDFIKALPPKLAVGVKALGLRDLFKLYAKKLVVVQEDTPGSRPDIWWNGQANFERSRLRLGVDVDNVTGAAACIGRYDGRQIVGLVGDVALDQAAVLKQPFQGVHAHFFIAKDRPNVLIVDELKAPVYGGEVSGQARLDFGGPVRYSVNLTASDVDLKLLGRHNLGPASELGGLAWGRLYLRGQGGDADDLDGGGSFHVPHGKLYNLPFLDDLLKFLGLRAPDRTTFDEAHAEFTIRGRRLEINHVDLWGSVLSLTGKGALNLDGTNAMLDFYPSWGPVEQLLPSAIRAVSPAVSKELLKIEMRGRIGGRPNELKLSKRVLPVVVDPFLQIRDRMRKASQKGGGSDGQ
jgi:hypothetical protein